MYGSYVYIWRIAESSPIYVFIPFEVLGFVKALDRHMSNTGTSASWAQKYDKLLYMFMKLRGVVQVLLSRKKGHIL